MNWSMLLNSSGIEAAFEKCLCVVLCFPDLSV